LARDFQAFGLFGREGVFEVIDAMREVSLVV
jgi:hypothetical protein